AFEAAVDAELDAAHAQPFVALILLHAPRRDGRLQLVHGICLERPHQLVHSNRQDAFLAHLIENAPLLRARARIPDARQPGGVQLLVLSDEIAFVQASRRRQFYQALRAVHDLAIQLAVFVTRYLAARRYRSVLADIPFLERRRIENV